MSLLAATAFTPPQEFISLRQAHDQLLIESTTVDRRVSLLDDRSPRGSGPQIMSRMRAASMVPRRSRASEKIWDPAFGPAPAVLFSGRRPASRRGRRPRAAAARCLSSGWDAGRLRLGHVGEPGKADSWCGMSGSLM